MDKSNPFNTQDLSTFSAQQLALLSRNPDNNNQNSNANFRKLSGFSDSSSIELSQILANAALQSQQNVQVQMQLQAAQQQQAQEQAQQAQAAQQQQNVAQQVVQNVTQQHAQQSVSITPNGPSLGPQPPHQPKRKGPIPKLTGKEKCLICQKSASGFNYLVLSCEGCKAFYRRSILKKAVYFCKDNNACDLTVKVKRMCQKCRLDKCVNLGMQLRDRYTMEMTVLGPGPSPPSNTSNAPVGSAAVEIKRESIEEHNKSLSSGLPLELPGLKLESQAVAQLQSQSSTKQRTPSSSSLKRTFSCNKQPASHQTSPNQPSALGSLSISTENLSKVPNLVLPFQIDNSTNHQASFVKKLKPDHVIPIQTMPHLPVVPDFDNFKKSFETDMTSETRSQHTDPDQQSQHISNNISGRRNVSSEMGVAEGSIVKQERTEYNMNQNMNENMNELPEQEEESTEENQKHFTLDQQGNIVPVIETSERRPSQPKSNSQSSSNNPEVFAAPEALIKRQTLPEHTNYDQYDISTRPSNLQNGNLNTDTENDKSLITFHNNKISKSENVRFKCNKSGGQEEMDLVEPQNSSLNVNLPNSLPYHNVRYGILSSENVGRGYRPPKIGTGSSEPMIDTANSQTSDIEVQLVSGGPNRQKKLLLNLHEESKSDTNANCKTEYFDLSAESQRSRHHSQPYHPLSESTYSKDQVVNCLNLVHPIHLEQQTATQRIRFHSSGTANGVSEHLSAMSVRSNNSPSSQSLEALNGFQQPVLPVEVPQSISCPENVGHAHGFPNGHGCRTPMPQLTHTNYFIESPQRYNINEENINHLKNIRDSYYKSFFPKETTVDFGKRIAQWDNSSGEKGFLKRLLHITNLLENTLMLFCRFSKEVFEMLKRGNISSSGLGLDDSLTMELNDQETIELSQNDQAIIIKECSTIAIVLRHSITYNKYDQTFQGVNGFRYVASDWIGIGCSADEVNYCYWSWGREKSIFFDCLFRSNKKIFFSTSLPP